MTAVKGIELLPPREDTVDSSREVKSKTEPSPFDRLLSKKTEEAAGIPKRNLNPEKAEAPVRARVYSAKKVAALLRAGREEGLLDSESRPDFAQLKKSDLSPQKEAQGILRKMGVLKTAYTAAGEKKGETENVPALIARFLKGEISPEELDALVAADRTTVKGLASGEKKTAEDLLASLVTEKSDAGEEGDLLKGFLTDDGKIVYFEELPPGEALKIDRSAKNNDSVKSVAGKNKIQFEVNVTDLRTAQAAQNQHQGAVQEGSALLKEKLAHMESQGHGADAKKGESVEDILSGPAEKLISAEGGGGRFQAPVSREVSRLFRDYMNDTGSKELVRKIDFILKDNNQGEIKLILKPEALGNVRINLSLNENHIAGKIFVDNSSVRDIFLNNMDNLTNLLKANGYEEASLEVWIGQDGQGGNNPSGGEREEEKNLRLLKGLESLEGSVPQTAQYDGSADGQVNLVI